MLTSYISTLSDVFLPSAVQYHNPHITSYIICHILPPSHKLLYYPDKQYNNTDVIDNGPGGSSLRVSQEVKRSINLLSVRKVHWICFVGMSDVTVVMGAHGWVRWGDVI